MIKQTTNGLSVQFSIFIYNKILSVTSCHLKTEKKHMIQCEVIASGANRSVVGRSNKFVFRLNGPYTSNLSVVWR